MRKVIAPQRDLFPRSSSGSSAFPGMTDDDQRYFRDVYDHLIRISDMVDTYRDLLTGAMDVYLSTVSNRLNGVMKQLAIIATVFMPLTFLTGFFGQNLGWMVGHVGGLGHFLVFGIGLELMTLAIVLGYFCRRGWLGAEDAAAVSQARTSVSPGRLYRFAYGGTGMPGLEVGRGHGGSASSRAGCALPRRRARHPACRRRRAHRRATLADASSSGSQRTPVAFSSFRVGGRESAHRPGSSFSVNASSTAFFSSGSVTVVAVPSTTTER